MRKIQPMSRGLRRKSCLTTRLLVWLSSWISVTATWSRVCGRSSLRLELGMAGEVDEVGEVGEANMVGMVGRLMLTLLVLFQQSRTTLREVMITLRDESTALGIHYVWGEVENTLGEIN